MIRKVTCAGMLVTLALIWTGPAPAEQQPDPSKWPDAWKVASAVEERVPSFGEVDYDGRAYAQATAHDPQYGDRSLWPTKLETDRAAYAGEDWPEATVLVWTGPGEGGERVQRLGAEAVRNPAFWCRANGRPAGKGPDRETDVVFPPSSRIHFKDTAFPARHVTLEPGSMVSFDDLQLAGNFWVKKGAQLTWHKGVFGRPDKDTFSRTDNETHESMYNLTVVGKQPEKGVEFIGRWRWHDQVMLHSGRFVIAPGSHFKHSDRFPLDIWPDGTLIVLSGATYEAAGNYYARQDLRIHGRLLAGTPERPLSEDCTIGLSFKSLGKGDFVRHSRPEDVSLILMPDGELAVHSSDPTKARLVLRWHRNPMPERSERRPENEPKAVAEMPHGISMRLFGEVDFDGVVLNDVIPRGIQIPDPSEFPEFTHITPPEKWRNATLGRGNFGDSLDELIDPAWTGRRPHYKSRSRE